MDALVVAAHAHRGLFAGLHLGDHVADRRIPSRELDAGRLADEAAAPVAPDEIPGPQRLAVGQLDVDAGVVLRETGDLTTAMDRHRQLVDPAGEYALDVLLRQREYVVVPGGEVADAHRDPGEVPPVLNHLSLREEAINDPTLIEDLDRA